MRDNTSTSSRSNELLESNLKSSPEYPKVHKTTQHVKGYRCGIGQRNLDAQVRTRAVTLSWMSASKHIANLLAYGMRTCSCGDQEFI